MLLEEGVYEAAYPLHDQLVREQDAGDPETWNDRMVRVQACRSTFERYLPLEIVLSLGEISKYISCPTDSGDSRLLR